jgi:hypothetical protein
VTREEGIAYLRSRGREAFARDWDLGETISVAIERPIGSPDDISVYADVLWICPVADGGWPSALQTNTSADESASSSHESRPATHVAETKMSR